MENPTEHTSNRIARFFSGRDFRDDIVVKILLAVVFLVLVVLMFPHSESSVYSYSVGSIWSDKDLNAQFSFPIYKDLHVYEKEKQEAVRGVFPIYERREEAARAGLDSVEKIFQALHVTAAARARWIRTKRQSDSLAFSRATDALPFRFAPADWRTIVQSGIMDQSSRQQPFQQVEQAIRGFVTDVFRLGVIDQVKIRKSHSQLAVRKGSTEEIISFDKVFDQEEAFNAIASRLSSLTEDRVLEMMGTSIFRTILRPNLIYNRNETNQAMQIAKENVPRTLGIVQANERIINKHDQITAETKLKLDSFRRARAERGTENTEWRHWLGITMHVCLVTGLFVIYVFLFRKKIFHDNGKLALIALIITIESFVAYLSLALDFSAPLQYLIVVPVASMLLAIIFDSRVAFYGTVAMALLIAGIRGNDYAIALTSLVAGALGAYTVRDIRNRTQIFRSMVFILFGYAVSIVALSLEEYESMNTVVTELTFALANAVISPVLTYGLLIFFERVFRITTDLTLLELADFNRPLLRELSENAPGTFHHSMTIGSLAEAAAEAIGANSILAKVGAYYHDIGKMLKPEYFVENQVGPLNRHSRLKPRMSALIIQSHVKDGVELGRKHRLPQQILDFIPQHHGTTRISFFYDKAIKQAAKRPDKANIQEEDFLYPGPKPQTKETAIVMLADSVEASTRAITDLTPQKLDLSIEGMIKQRFVEGQLDECELTLRDLTRIKEEFLKILLGVHHQRVTYPEQNVEVQQVVEQKVPDETPQAIDARTETVSEDSKVETLAPPPNDEPHSVPQGPLAGDGEREKNLTVPAVDRLP